MLIKTQEGWHSLSGTLTDAQLRTMQLSVYSKLRHALTDEQVREFDEHPQAALMREYFTYDRGDGVIQHGYVENGHRLLNTAPPSIDTEQRARIRQEHRRLLSDHLAVLEAHRPLWKAGEHVEHGAIIHSTREPLQAFYATVPESYWRSPL